MLETMFAAIALASSATLLEADDTILDRALSECGFEGEQTAVIDARNLTDASELARRVEALGEVKPIIAGGEFSGADMRPHASSFGGGCFFQTDLSGTIWSEAGLQSTRFIGVDLSKANLASAYLDAAHFIGVNASEANFAGARLGSAKWVGQNWTSKLDGASFVGAKMNYFTFDCGITMDMQCGGGDGVDFSGADLNNANLASYPIWGFDEFKGANFNRAYISPRALRYLDDVEVARSITLGYRRDAVDDRRPQVRLSSDEFKILQAQVKAASRDEPSFDCAAASTTVETLICGEYESELRRMDRDMAKLYGQAIAAGKTTRSDQRRWLRERDGCETRECIEAFHMRRMDELGGAIGLEIPLAPDATLQFEDDVVPVPDSFRADPLYLQLIPAIRLVSMQGVTLTGREDGRIEARGEAVGGNAHTCSLYGDELVYNPDNGWYSGELADGTLVPILRVWDNRLFFRYSGNMGDTPDEAGNFISCGARAGFSEMRLLGK